MTTVALSLSLFFCIDYTKGCQLSVCLPLATTEGSPEREGGVWAEAEAKRADQHQQDQHQHQDQNQDQGQDHQQSGEQAGVAPRLRAGWRWRKLTGGAAGAEAMHSHSHSHSHFSRTNWTPLLMTTKAKSTAKGRILRTPPASQTSLARWGWHRHRTSGSRWIGIGCSSPGSGSGWWWWRWCWRVGRAGAGR